MPNLSPVHRLLIRADAGPKMGTGHVMRCLALGQAWQKMGGQVTIITSSLPARLAMRINTEEFELEMLPADRSPQEEIQIFNDHIARQNPDWVVLDGYQFDDFYQESICLNGSRLLVVDDFGHGNHAGADAIFNQNVYAEIEDYTLQKKSQDIIAGLEFVLIRDEFDLDHGPPASNRKIAMGNAKRILVTFGGADPHNTTLDVIRVLDQCAEAGTSVDVIVGHCNPYFESLKTAAKQSRLSIRFHANVDRMASLLQRTDLAITAAGSTCYELCHAGVPMIAIPIVNNQIEVANCLVRRGAAETVEQNDLCNGNAQKVINRIIRNPQSRESMSLVGRKLVDGQGAARLARRLCSHLYRFRKAEKQDAAMLLDWHNDSEIRATRFGAAAVESNQLPHWLLEQLGDEQHVNWIVENAAGRPVGQVLLESTLSNRTAIGINLVPSMRGKGIGTSLIEAACRLATRLLGNVEFVAYIKPIDFASQTAFRKAGFKTVATTTINGQVALEFSFCPSSPSTTEVVSNHHMKAS